MAKLKIKITDAVHPGAAVVVLEGAGLTFVRRSSDPKAKAVLTHEVEVADEAAAALAAQLRADGYEVEGDAKSEESKKKGTSKPASEDGAAD